jgi:CRISPR-associated protein Cmr2
MNTFIAITIGPIYKTFQNVRKTRELWAASYIFSFISKRFIEEIIKIDKQAILSPHYDANTPIGIGLYPDRIFFKASDQLTITNIEAFKKMIYEEVAQWLKDPSSEQFLANYLRIYSVEYKLDDSQNPIKEGNDLLDVAEMRCTWELQEKTNLLLKFFRSVNTQKINNEKWIIGHFAEKDINEEVRFESMPEISTRAIRTINTILYKDLVKKYCYKGNDIDEDESFIKDIQKGLNLNGKTRIFKNYHKYVCIVKADGDKVGKYIKAIKDKYEYELNALSAALFKWGVETSTLVKNYSGIPIYIGGDDVLFLAPIVGVNSVNIIELTKEINNSFVEHFNTLPERIDDKEEVIKPTLSFGVSITYYKFPLFESLDKADYLLYKAKETRNTCTISLLKHSGSQFDISLPNDSTNNIRNSFNEAEKHFADDKSFISSIIYHFIKNEDVYRIIGNDALKVTNFLKNNFDNEKHKKFVECVAELCSTVYIKNSGTTGKDESKKSIDEIYSFLRIIKFLKGQDDGK